MGKDDESHEDKSTEERDDRDDEIAQLKVALHKANEQAKRMRLRAKDQPPPDADADETLAAERKARTDDADRYRRLIAAAQVRADLATAGVSKPERLVRMVDLGEIQINDDGTVTGIAEQLAALKKDFPELFIHARSGTDLRGGEPRREAPAPEKISSAEQIAKELLGV